MEIAYCKKYYDFMEEGYLYHKGNQIFKGVNKSRGNWICAQKRSHLDGELNGAVMTDRYGSVQKSTCAENKHNN